MSVRVVLEPFKVCAQVGSVAVKFGKLLLARQLTPHCIKQAFLEGINHVSSPGSLACSPRNLCNSQC